MIERSTALHDAFAASACHEPATTVDRRRGTARPTHHGSGDPFVEVLGVGRDVARRRLSRE